MNGVQPKSDEFKLPQPEVDPAADKVSELTKIISGLVTENREFRSEIAGLKAKVNGLKADAKEAKDDFLKGYIVIGFVGFLGGYAFSQRPARFLAFTAVGGGVRWIKSSFEVSNPTKTTKIEKKEEKNEVLTTLIIGGIATIFSTFLLYRLSWIAVPIVASVISYNICDPKIGSRT